MTPVKNRTIDYGCRVKVYRNLHKKGRWYSIMQFGLVVAHAQQLMLGDAVFKVSQAGRRRVLKTGRKNVHAFVTGCIAKNGLMGMLESDGKPLPAKVTYNPRAGDTHFMVNNLTTDGYEIASARAVCINEHGVTAAYTEKRYL